MTKYVKVKFVNGYNSNLYDYKTDLELKVGDTVVVDSSNGMQVVEVRAIDVESSKATKWVISKVDMTAHQLRLEKEKKLKAIKTKLEQRRKQIQDIEVYTILAQNDPEMQKLLDEFKSII